MMPNSYAVWMRLNSAASASLHRVGRRTAPFTRGAGLHLTSRDCTVRARTHTHTTHTHTHTHTHLPARSPRRAGSLAEATYTENRVAVRRTRRKPRQRGNAAWPTSWSLGDVHAAGRTGGRERKSRATGLMSVRPIGGGGLVGGANGAGRGESARGPAAE